MAKIRIGGACENNLKNVDVDLAEGLTVVTGVSGSGKSSLVFDTLYHEAHRRLMEVFNFGGGLRLAPARVASLSGVGPAVAVEQNLLNRNPSSTLASFSGLHP
jgi:excinuclease ABC subunit A